MFTIESTIIDIAIGTEETDLLKASDWFGSDLDVSLKIGMWESENRDGGLVWLCR